MVVGRFAPSPSGRLHLGNLFCCLLAWLSARQQEGRVVLRVEDLDTARCPRRYAVQAMEDLQWLGLTWDEGPGVGGTEGPYFQSERTALYRAALKKLEDMGLVYPCFCTRAELHAASAPHREDGQVIYPGTCRRLTAAQAAEKAKVRAPALRLRVPDEVIAFTDRHMGPYAENLARDCGDFLLRRSDGMFAYQLAVVVDDAAQGVTSVVRGVDLLCSTPQQLYLQELLGLPHPAYAHIPLLVAERDRRLSKRDRDAALDALLARFKTPEAVIGHIAGITGLAPTCDPATPEELLATFDLAALPTTFDDLVQVRWR